MNHTAAKAKGFTLIELMIVVAVIAILGAIAYPSYVNYVVETRRGTAAACLVEMGQYMERHFTTNLSYEIDRDVFNGIGFECKGDLADFYDFDFTADPTATAYVLQADPKGAQDRDTECGILTLNQEGARTANGSTSAATVSECW